MKRKVKVVRKQKDQTKKFVKGLWKAICFLGAFCAWTAAVKEIDVQPIGALGTEVGFATLNEFFHRITGVNWFLYHITDWLSLIPIGIVFGFAFWGLRQWIVRKKLALVDRDLMALGGFYVLVLAVYLLFEVWVINYRPVLINGVLEASYPSSTTVMMLCVMPTAAMQMRRRIQNKRIKRWVLIGIFCFAAFMVAGRILSGVHWISDIVGGVLLSAGLVELYRAAAQFYKSENCD